MPGEHHRDNHHLLGVLLIPLLCPGNGVVENEPCLPEPRTLEKYEVAPRQRYRHVLPELELDEADEYVGVDHIDEQGMDQNIHGGSSVGVEHEEDVLYDEGQGRDDVVDVLGQRKPEMDEDVHYTGQSEEEEHGRVLTIAEVREPSVLESCNDLTREADGREEDLQDALPWPSPHPTAQTVEGEGHRRSIRLAAFAQRPEVATVSLDGPPDGEDNEEGSREGVASEGSHFGIRSDQETRRLGSSGSYN